MSWPVYKHTLETCTVLQLNAAHICAVLKVTDLTRFFVSFSFDPNKSSFVFRGHGFHKQMETVTRKVNMCVCQSEKLGLLSSILSLIRVEHCKLLTAISFSKCY